MDESYLIEKIKLGTYDFIVIACKNNRIEKLEWLKNSKYIFEYDEAAINNASGNGHFQVLEWFKHSGYEFKYDERAINGAINNGHVQVLEWFKHSGYEFKYHKWAIYGASEKGHIQVLEWFKHSGYKFKYNNYAIIYAKNIIILKWFIENINLKKVVNFSRNAIVKTLKFKTKKRYFKGYKKN